MKQEIVFLDRGTVPPTLTFPAELDGVSWREYERTDTATDAEARQRLAAARICVVNKFPLRQQLLSQLPQLQLIALTATGSNNIDLSYCRQRGIAVSNVVAYGTASIVEHVFALILALTRKLFEYREAAFTAWQHASSFAILRYPVSELAGKVLVVVGKGTLGSAVGRLGLAFGMEVLYAERKGAATVRTGYTAFAAALKRADVMSLHVPLTSGTRDLLGQAELAQLKTTALLINTARGGLVDEAALVTALHAGKLGGAGIDVTAPEPPLADNPLLALKSLPNVILTPHMAWGGDAALTELRRQVLENIRGFIRGKSLRRLV